MFDLDAIENDWKLNSFCLSDEEVLEIFKTEGATLSAYREKLDLFNANLPRKYTAEDILMANLFHDEEKLDDIRRANELRAKMFEEQYPKKKYLSQDSQAKVVEGCMDVVFENARFWFKRFNSRVSLEKIYYICLYSLFDSVKYCLHYSTKSCFRAYVSKGIMRNIVKNVSKWEHISYREAFEMICKDSSIDLCEDYEKEIPTKSSVIYDLLKNECYEVDYDGKASESMFMDDYRKALALLTHDERKVMELLFDSTGVSDFTLKQVSEFLVVEPEIVKSLKKSALKKLRRCEKLDKYRM